MDGRANLDGIWLRTDRDVGLVPSGNSRLIVCNPAAELHTGFPPPIESFLDELKLLAMVSNIGRGFVPLTCVLCIPIVPVIFLPVVAEIHAAMDVFICILDH